MRELSPAFSYIPITRLLVRAVTPVFGAYPAEEAALTGALRHSHSRLMEFAEEVAFFQKRRLNECWLREITLDYSSMSTRH